MDTMVAPKVAIAAAGRPLTLCLSKGRTTSASKKISEIDRMVASSEREQGGADTGPDRAWWT